MLIKSIRLTRVIKLIKFNLQSPIRLTSLTSPRLVRQSSKE